MKTAAIEINDAGLILASGGELGQISPGYALLGGGTVTVGEAARRVARLEPRNVDSRFWHELDEQPLTQPAAMGRSRADLAYAHLQQLWSAEQADVLTCAVPGTMRPAQLGLILGIAHAGGIPLGSFIDSAVAAASAWGGRGRFVYIDVHLHQALATAVDVGEEARRERIESTPRAGLIALQDSWMRLIARLFIARTRFDPLHHAATEQALFDALPEVVRKLGAEASAEVEISFGSDRHRVSVTREEFLLESQPLYARIIMNAHRLRRAGHPLTIALSAAAAALPGLSDRFGEFKDAEIVAFPPGASALAAERHAQSWPAQQESATLFRTAPILPAASALMPARIQTAQPAAARRAPTHVLYQGKAHALTPQPLIAGLAPGASRLQITGAAAGISPLHCSLLRQFDEAEVIDFSRYGTYLNDERVTGRAPLHAGDRLRVGTPGVTLELIDIESGAVPT